jgi:hypothetical protein
MGTLSSALARHGERKRGDRDNLYFYYRYNWRCLLFGGCCFAGSPPITPGGETGCIIPHRRVSPDHERPGPTYSRKKTTVCDDVFQDASSKTHGQPSLTLQLVEIASMLIRFDHVAQLHRKRESQHCVNGCETSRS